MHADRQLAISREIKLLGSEDPAGVFHIQPHATSRVSRVRHDDIGNQRGPYKNGARDLHTLNLDVGADALASQAHGVDRHGGRLQSQESVGHRLPRVVGSVTDHDQTGERQPGQFLLGAVHRGGQIGTATGKPQLAGAGYPGGIGGKAIVADPKPLFERLSDGTFGLRLLRFRRCRSAAEQVADELTARAAVHVGHAHAPRVVQQHGNEVPLWNHGRDKKHRLEETEQHQCQGSRADSRQEEAIQAGHVSPDPAVAQQGRNQERQDRDAGGQSPPGEGENQLPPLEDERSVFEQELEHGLARSE